MELFTPTPSNLSTAIADRLPNLALCKPDTQLQITSLALLLEMNNKRYQHRIYKGYYFSHDQLIKHLGRDYLDKILSTGCIEITGEYDPYHRVTRGYDVTQSCKQAIFDHLNNHNTPSYQFITDKGARVRKNKHNRYTSIKAKNKYGIKAMNPHRDKINGLIGIDTTALNQLSISLKNLSDTYILGIGNNCDNPLFRHVEHELLKVQKTKRKSWIEDRIKESNYFYTLATTNIDLPHGCIIQQYQESTTGRLYGVGTHLQSSTRIVRKCALNGQYDYDFDNCHYAVFEQLASRSGHDLKHIKYYLSHKSKVRKSLSQDLNISIDEIKHSIIALIYGASINEVKRGNHECALVKKLGINKAKRLVSDELFVGMHNDIKKGASEVFEVYKKRGGLVNAVGKRLDERSTTDRLSHILQGHEIQMLNVAIEHYGSDISLLQHDGFTSPNGEIDITHLSQLIYEKTGFRISISKERLTNT